MLLQCWTPYANKFGKLSSGHRTGKGPFSFQYQRRAMPKNVQTTIQLHSYNDNPLQCSCLENPRDRGAWWAAVYGVTQSRTRLKWLTSSSSSWHIECSTFTASSFRIWNSSTGILSPPLALFVVMLSKAHLTSHSKMSGSRSVITPSWLSGSWRSFFVQFFCVFLPPLLNIFCFC